jgi:hypothetical protein
MTDMQYIVAGLSLLLLCFLTWKETKRQNKARLTWRILATVFAVIGLACIALPISYNRQLPVATGNNPAILLTEGYSKESVEGLLGAGKKTVSIFTLDETLIPPAGYNSSLVTNIDSVFAKQFGVVHIFGYGLDKDELDAIKEQPIIFHPSKLSGITGIQWQHKINSGDKLSVQGSFTNPSSSAKKIVLSDFNTTLDSVIIKGTKPQPFQLTATPKQLGRAVLSLSIVDNRDTLEKEPIPVQVEQGSPVKLLMLASTPDFENRFLKNWLGQKGYELVARTAISKNKFDKAHVNTSNSNTDRITNELLDKFNVVIADAAELASLSQQELQAIQTQVMQKGKGLIVRVDSMAARNAFYANRFPLVHLRSEPGQKISLQLTDSSETLQPLNIENAFFIALQNGTLPLVTDKQNRVFVNSMLYGSGKIILSTVPNTFSWALSGDQSGYDNYWSELLNNAAGKKITEENWQTAPLFAEVNKPVTIFLTTANTVVPQAQLEGSTVALVNHADLPFNWTGKFWPRKQGWQSGIQLNGDPWYWYAYGKQDWKTVRATAKTLLTGQKAAENRLTGETSVQPAVSQKVAINKIWFFIIFLICCGYLWFENKYYNP